MKNKNIVILLIALAILGTIGAFVVNFCNSSISDNISDWGNFGGYIGGTLSLISVVLIYYTYSKQSEMNYRNQFESIFFEMLSRQREIYRDIDGYNLFLKLRADITAHFQTSFEYEFTKEEAEELFANYFSYHISSKQACLHYFRHIYHIIKYVHSDRIISPADKKRYIDMIQAEMSDDELFVSFFNVIWWHYKSQKKNYLIWLDKYSFFENLQSSGKWFDFCKMQLFTHTKWKHSTSQHTTDDLDLGEVDYSKEQWNDTLDRLHEGTKATQ